MEKQENERTTDDKNCRLNDPYEWNDEEQPDAEEERRAAYDTLVDTWNAEETMRR